MTSPKEYRAGSPSHSELGVTAVQFGGARPKQGHPSVYQATESGVHWKKQMHGFPGGAHGKEPACQCRRRKRHEFDPWVGKIPWRREWQPTPAVLPGESQGQRSLVGYNPRGQKELDTTEGTQLAHSMSIVSKLLFGGKLGTVAWETADSSERPASER